MKKALARFVSMLIVGSACIAEPIMGQTPVRAGEEFQINSYTTSDQRFPSVAIDENGNFIVVWWSDGPDGSQRSAQGQRFDSVGAAVGGEFQINSYTTNSQGAPSVAMERNGDFVVLWESYRQDGSSWSVQGQQFDAAGIAVGGEFQVNSYTTNDQGGPSVAMDAEGNFAVVWNSLGQDGDDFSVQGQRFDAAGAAVGGEFQVNTYTSAYQGASGVAMDVAGNFVVVWSSYGQDNDGFSVQGQRFGSAGNTVGGEFQINSYTTSNQFGRSVAVDANGDFVVAWTSEGPDGSGYSVQGHSFDSLGVPLGSEFQINSYTTGNQASPQLTMDGNGNFVVVWHGTGKADGYGIKGQRFDNTGARFQVNSYTTDTQRYASVVMGESGNFVVVWESLGQDGDGLSIQGQRFVFPIPIFTDGFESGDTSAWSSTVP